MHNELRYKQGTKESVKSTFILSKSKAFLRHGNAYNSVSFFQLSPLVQGVIETRCNNMHGRTIFGEQVASEKTASAPPGKKCVSPTVVYTTSDVLF